MKLLNILKKLRKKGSFSVAEDVCYSTIKHIVYLINHNDRFANLDCVGGFIQLYDVLNNSIDVLRFYADDKEN